MVRRGERGQGSMEVVGVIALAALLTTAAVGATVAKAPEVSHAICTSINTLTGKSGGCADAPVAEPPTPSPTRDPGMKVDYPVDGTPESPVCLQKGDQPESDRLPEGEIKVKKKFYDKDKKEGLLKTDEVTLKASNITVDANGKEWQTVSIINDARLTARGEATLKGVKIGAEGFAGNKVTYAVTVPPSSTKDLLNGEPPNVLDPTSIPVGGNVTLNAQAYAGYGLDAGYKLLKTENKYSVGEDVSTAVVRLPDGKVRVLVGPSTIIEESLKATLGTSTFNIGAYIDNKYTDYHLKQADFDITSPGGQSAYYAMVLTGSTPKNDGNGVSNLATVEGEKYYHRSGLTGTLGPLSGKLILNGTDQNYAVTEYANGNVLYTDTATQGDVTISASQMTDYSGNILNDQSSYQLRLRNVDPKTVDKFNHLYGHSMATVNGNQNMVLNFTADDYQRLESQAYVILADRINKDSNWDGYFGHKATPDDIRGYIAEANSLPKDQRQQRLDMLTDWPGKPRAMAIEYLVSDNRFETLLRMMQGESGIVSPGRVVEFLTDWQMAYDDAAGDPDGKGSPGLGTMHCLGTS